MLLPHHDWSFAICVIFSPWRKKNTSDAAPRRCVLLNQPSAGRSNSWNKSLAFSFFEGATIEFGLPRWVDTLWKKLALL